ncbi:unnamed protein product, partial [marine sediment metagenome]
LEETCKNDFLHKGHCSPVEGLLLKFFNKQEK